MDSDRLFQRAVRQVLYPTKHTDQAYRPRGAGSACGAFTPHGIGAGHTAERYDIPCCFLLRCRFLYKNNCRRTAEK